MNTQVQPTLYMVEGLSHEYKPSDWLTLREDRAAQDWVKQWTTPANTKRVIASGYDEAVKKWREQPFGIPGDMSLRVVQCLEFKIQITPFGPDGVEMYGRGVRYQTVKLIGEEDSCEGESE